MVNNVMDLARRGSWSSFTNMRRHALSLLPLSALFWACAPESEAPVQASLPDPEPSEVLLQAVDAGTGGALADARMTVRHLVRSPITLDAFASEEVSSGEPYRIAHAVAEDRLVVEVRLEAPSYHRMDTVLAVARGASAGPFTIRMTRRLDRTAASSSSRPSGRRPPARPTDPDDGVDRSALRAGDRAFRSGNWAGATRAYARMIPPERRTGAYAEEYAHALVNWGVSHIHLGEWGSALSTLEEAVGYEASGPSAYLHLTQAQCGVGRTDAGLRTLDELAGLPTIPAGERRAVTALIEYQRGMCSQGVFDQAQSAIEVVRTGGQAIRELNGFIELGEALRPRPPEVDQALADARRRVEAIRGRMRRLRG